MMANVCGALCSRAEQPWFCPVSENGKQMYEPRAPACAQGRADAS